MLEKTLHYILEIEHVAWKSNDGADALFRMGCDNAEAPEETQNFYSTRVAMISTSRIKKVGTMRNIPLNLQIIVPRSPDKHKICITDSSSSGGNKSKESWREPSWR